MGDNTNALDELEKLNNIVSLVNETMQQSTPDQAGGMVDDLLNQCQLTHNFLEHSAEDVIEKGEEDLFDRIAEALESSRQAREKYSEWVLSGGSRTAQTTPVAAKDDAIEPQLADIDERLMTSSMPGELFTRSMSLAEPDKPAEMQSKKKKKEGKKKKDPKDNKDTVGMDQDLWNSWGGVETAPFQEGGTMDALGAWPTVGKSPEQFPPTNAFGSFGDGEKSAPLPKTSMDDTTAFPLDSFPRLVEQPLPPPTSPTAGQNTSVIPQARQQNAVFGQEDTHHAQPSASFGQDDFASPFRASRASPTQQSIVPPKMEQQPSNVSPQPPPASPPGSGWRSPRSQKSIGIPIKQDKVIEEVPGTITVQLRMPRIQHFDDLPSSFSTLFATELSEALNISESRIKVLGVTPTTQGA